jgi:hexosaminidase
MRVGMSLFLVGFPELGVQMWGSLSVTPKTITINAVEEAGLFRGSRTLIQLLEQGRTTGSLPCLTITDYPRFPWRGMHLDPCRHFWSVEFTKKYIDLLARYKMNSFHWHLTDDQGWRIEIKKYPKLTEWCLAEGQPGRAIQPEGIRQQPLRRLLHAGRDPRGGGLRGGAAHQRGARDRDAGPCDGGARGLPALGLHRRTLRSEKGWGVFEDVFCAGNDSVFAMSWRTC